MLGDGSGYVWLLLLLYVIPVVIFYKSVMRFYKKGKGSTSDVGEVPASARPEIKRFYKITLLVPVALFLIFLAFRIYAPEVIYAKNLQSKIFDSLWIYVMIAGIPIALYGIFSSLRSLYRGKPGSWPILCLFGSFAALFVISIFSVLLLIV